MTENTTNKYQIQIIDNYWKILQIEDISEPRTGMVFGVPFKIDAYTYSLDDYDMRAHRRIWKHIFLEGLIEKNSNVLLINDADQIFYNCINIPTTATIVDPHAYEFTKPYLSKYLFTSSFINTVDSFGFKRTLTLIDEEFMDAWKDQCFRTKYDLIFVNVKDRHELSVEYIERYFLMLKEFGFLALQFKSEDYHISYKNTIEHYFTSLYEKVRTTRSDQKLVHYFLFRKISSLI